MSWCSFNSRGELGQRLALGGARRASGFLTMLARVAALGGLMLAVATAAAAQAEGSTIPLFDGATLDGWARSDFHPSGDVVVREGAVVLSAGDPLTGITYAGDFPRDEYEVLVEARRLEGSDFFATITFPVGDDYVSLVVGGWGGKVVGLSSLEGDDASQNETTRWISFEDQRWYRIQLRVADGRVSAWLDGERIVDLAYAGRLLAPRVEVLPSRPFGIASWNTTAEIRRIELTPLSDGAKSPPAGR